MLKVFADKRVLADISILISALVMLGSGVELKVVTPIASAALFHLVGLLQQPPAALEEKPKGPVG